MHKEADDLKLESFGVEVGTHVLWCIAVDPRSPQLLHTIGNIYIMKATSFMKSRKFLGMYVHSPHIQSTVANRPRLLPCFPPLYRDLADS
jgi:hypothetical protein